jgi:hypothetical protein
MSERFCIRDLSIPLGILVLALLLFPAAHGSFISTHGPVTALRALQSAAAILLAITVSHVLLMIRAAAACRPAPVPLEKPAAAQPDREATCSLIC